MGILYINTITVGQVDQVPRFVKCVTTASLAAFTTAGYLNPVSLQGFALYPTDLLFVWYGATNLNSPGTFGIFQLSISGSGVITADAWENPGDVLLPVVSGDFAAFNGTSGQIKDFGYLPSDATKTKVVMANAAVATSALAGFTDTAGTVDDGISNLTNSITTASATPGTIRALVGANAGTNAVMTSGNLVGVRGSVTLVGASGGFLYGTQGKIIASGTLSGSSWTAGVFGQLDISAATVNAGQTACLWGDYGTTSGTISDATGMRGVAMTNTTAAVLNAQDYRYGNATYLLELAGAGGTLNYYAAAGTSGGSAGDATHCAAQKVIAIEVNGVAAYIPVFTQNS